MSNLESFLRVVSNVCPAIKGDMLETYFDNLKRQLAANLEIDVVTTHREMEDLEFRVVNQLLEHAYEQWKLIDAGNTMVSWGDDYFDLVQNSYHDWESEMVDLMRRRIFNSARIDQRQQLRDNIEAEIGGILRPNDLKNVWHNCYSCHRIFLREDCNDCCDNCNSFLVVETDEPEEAVNGKQAIFMFAPEVAVPYEEWKLRSLAGDLSCKLELQKFESLDDDHVPIGTICACCGERRGHETWTRTSCCKVLCGSLCLENRFGYNFLCPFCGEPFPPDSTVGVGGSMNAIAAGVLFASRMLRRDPELMPRVKF